MSRAPNRRVIKFLAEFYQSDTYKKSQQWLHDLVQRNMKRMYNEPVQPKEMNDGQHHGSA